MNSKHLRPDDYSFWSVTAAGAIRTVFGLVWALGRSPYSVDFYLEKRFPIWRHISEWASAQALDQEPRQLSRNTQIVTVIGIVVMLTIFMTIIGGEMNAAAAQTTSSIPNVIQMVSLYHFLL
jgi:hypothetical protein